MLILGVNYFFHDTSACLIKDGKLIVAVEEERLSRKKHTNEFPILAIERCLKDSGFSYDDIDHIAVSINPKKDIGKKVIHAIKNISGIKGFLRHELVSTRWKQKELKAWHQNNFKSNTPIHYVDHHLSHSVGSFLVSPYEKAALLSIDGSGEWSTAMLGEGNGNEFKVFQESYFPHSLGSFYEAVTEFCGFKPNYDEGKTMGLAPFGDANQFIEEVRKVAWVDDSGQIKLNHDYFSFKNWGHRRCSNKFYEVFGKPRGKTEEFQQYHKDVAAAFQKVLEECALKLCKVLKQKTDAEYLVIAGGVALNSVMNGRLLREAGFKDVYVMPAAGDNGTSIGAAYYLNNIILNQPRNFVHDDPCICTSYDNDQIKTELDKYKLEYEFEENVTQATAQLLSQGAIIGWFQGKMEIGPRALGARSILADPTHQDMKTRINAEIKYREAYRPFAPSAIKEVKNKYFDMEKAEAPFMLKVCNVRKEYQKDLPAITHFDGTARLQTVDKEVLPTYYSLIKNLGDISGFPVILNTSFNVMGEPVVESPKDAIRCFYSCGLDCLVIGNYIVKKQASAWKDSVKLETA